MGTLFDNAQHLNGVGVTAPTLHAAGVGGMSQVRNQAMQGIKCRWFDKEKTIIYEEFGTRWNWSDLEQIIDTVNELLAETSGEVDFIVDVHQTVMMPPHMLIQNFKKFCQLPVQNPRYGQSMVVGLGGFVRGFWQMFSNLYERDAENLRVELADSVEDAHARILERRRIIIDKTS